jgi:hypothetical protein
MEVLRLVSIERYVDDRGILGINSRIAYEPDEEKDHESLSVSS